MLIDLTLNITPFLINQFQSSTFGPMAGHLGTHLDVMDQVFPLPYMRRRGVVFDVRHVKQRDIDISDIDLSQVHGEMFAAFYSGFLEREGYGSAGYFTNHPQLSNSLIDVLLRKQVSIIGLDFAGIRRGDAHFDANARCARLDTFVVENLCNLDALLQGEKDVLFSAHTYPMHFSGLTGLPCRVVGEI